MNRDTELQLIDELLAIKAAKSFYLDEKVTKNPVEHYLSQDRFQLERDQIFKKVPMVAAHGSEMALPGDFLRREVAGLSILLTRDKAGMVHAFLNACRHRGTRLVDDEKGCKHRFSCPYHAWTYANSGELIAAPHFEQGFGDLEKSDLGLIELSCEERYGFIWVRVDEGIDLDTHLAEIAGELDALNMDDMVVVHQNAPIHKANWKILVEGGIEAYHFKVAHRSTIGPHFEDNLSSYRMLGSHMRSILMRTSMANLSDETRDSWRLRDHAQVLYTLFPNTALLLQSDHVAWINQEALSAGETRVRMSTLVPKTDAERTEHWQRNHEITRVTLDEDFTIGESIQSTLSSGANQNMLFGKFEGALDAFNKVVEAHLVDPASQAVAAE
ncbi:MAG: SRPBCC family protein [Pseudomonadota bacterium]